ncbi:DUF4215 domain-containing protein, partial [Candidatus Falkowbacteria bacterium]|nr:DUF4215 domain-containing protein [Candidatus Falkowbacteria bacterium]
PAQNGVVNVNYKYSVITLGNGYDEIILTCNNIEVDKVEYDDGATFPDPNGASMVLASPNLDNNNGHNWCASFSVFGAGDKGTPGSQNDSCACAPVCGNGVVETGETCDDGQNNGVDGLGNLTWSGQSAAICGNGVVETGETCDDGNSTNGDGCNSVCQVEPPSAVCGNSIKESGEECDGSDGLAPGERCTEVCRLEVIISSSGGGGNPTPQLIIFDEQSFNIMDTVATITWRTNLNSASRVIYAPEGGNHNFNYLNPPNYGYDYSTVDDLSMVTGHSVQITGLTPGTTYYYRTISHASPDTVSAEHSFKTTGEQPSEQTGGEQGNQGGQQGGQIGESPTTETDNAGVVNNLSANMTGQVAGIAITAPAGNEIGAEQGSEEPGKILGAGEQNGVVAGAQNTCKSWPWVKTIILAIIYILLLLINYVDKIQKNIREKYGAYLNWAYLVLPIVMAVMVFVVGWAWWIWPILIILYFLLLIFYFSTPLRDSWRASVALTIYFLAILMILKDYLCY